MFKIIDGPITFYNTTPDPIIYVLSERRRNQNTPSRTLLARWVPLGTNASETRRFKRLGVRNRAPTSAAGTRPTCPREYGTRGWHVEVSESHRRRRMRVVALWSFPQWLTSFGDTRPRRSGYAVVVNHDASCTRRQPTHNTMTFDPRERLRGRGTTSTDSSRWKQALTIIAVLVVVGLLPAVVISISFAALPLGTVAAAWLLYRRVGGA